MTNPAAQLQFSGLISFLPSGDYSFDRLAQWQNGNSPGPQGLTTIGTNTTITVPSNPAPVGVVIAPQAGNQVVLTLKGVAGDTGFPLHLTNPTAIALGALSSFVLSAPSSIRVEITWV